MIASDYVDIAQNGAVLLGPDIVCDGFYYDSKVRVQSHYHLDHMDEFNTSKGVHKILMSKPTYELLVAQKNADIPIRGNIKSIEYCSTYNIDNCEICLLSSGHVLGSVQTRVVLSNGLCVGYSGDFDWPLKKVIQVDVLVVDSTYGSPSKMRNYTKEDATDCLMELISNQIKEGPINLIAHRGTLERALDLIGQEYNMPIVASDATYKEVQVYAKHGYCMPPLISTRSAEWKDIRDNKHIRIYRSGECREEPSNHSSTIILSRFMGSPNEPLLKHSDSTFRIGLTAHADFEGTMEYIVASNARKIITDNVRGPYAVELSLEIKARLGIDASPSSNNIKNPWRD